LPEDKIIRYFNSLKQYNVEDIILKSLAYENMVIVIEKLTMDHFIKTNDLSYLGYVIEDCSLLLQHLNKVYNGCALETLKIVFIYL
jgi:hypothetical protein